MLLATFLRVFNVVQAEPIEDGPLGILLVREIHGTHVLVIKIFDGEVSKKSTISKLVPC